MTERILRKTSSLEQYLTELREVIEDGQYRVSVERKKITDGNTSDVNFDELGRLESRLGSLEGIYEEGENHLEYARYFVLEEPSSDINWFDEIENPLNKSIDAIRQFLLTYHSDIPFKNHPCMISFEVMRRNPALVPYLNRLKKTYQELAEDRGLTITRTGSQDETSQGLVIEGDFAYGLFSGEDGVHKMIYTAPSKKKQTGHIGVCVTPILSEPDEYIFDDSEFNTRYFGASSKGGQHANKNENNVELTHEPTGLKVTQKGRSRRTNLNRARSLLERRIKEDKESKRTGRNILVPETFFRTYDFTQGQFVRDDYLGEKVTLDKFFSGEGLSYFIEERMIRQSGQDRLI